MPTLAELIKFAMAASILMLVVSLGMRATLSESTSFFRNLFQPPRRLLRATFAINVVVPVIAATVVGVFNLPLPIKVALIAISVSPVPPILPAKELKFGGRTSYVFGLLVAVSLTSIILVPITIQIMGWLFNREAHIGPIDIAIIVGKTVILPLALGMLIRSVAPEFADRIGNTISRLAMVLLVVSLLPVLYKVLPGMWALIGDGSVLAIAGVVFAAILAGQWIGGPQESDRTALGITSAMRHPGIALAIATRNFPDNALMPAAILMYVLIAAIVTTIYGKLRTHSDSESPAKLAHQP